MAPHIVQVLNGIYSVGPIPTVGTGRQSATSPFLVVGERAAIIEPGEYSQVAPFLEAVEEIGVSLDRIDYLIPTHLHLHHCSSLNDLVPRIPHAKVLVHQRGVEHAIDPTRLNRSTQQAFAGQCNLALNAVPKNRVISVAGGEVFDLGGRKLEIIDAPGHAPHNFGVYDTLTRALWMGDFPEFQAGSKRGQVSIQPPLFHVERALETLRRFRAAHPAVLLKWYGGIAHYQPETLIDTAIEDILAIEEIALDGMKKKQHVHEVEDRVREYIVSVGATVERAVQEEWREAEHNRDRQAGRTRLIGLFRYLQQKHSGLELPVGTAVDNV